MRVENVDVCEHETLQCLRPSSDVAYIPTLFANIGLCRAKRRASLCYPQDMVGLYRSDVTTWRPHRGSCGQPNKSRIIYTIAAHRALGFGKIAASYVER